MIVASESTTRERTSIAMAGAEALARNTLTWVPGSTPGRPSRPMQYRRGTVGLGESLAKVVSRGFGKLMIRDHAIKGLGSHPRGAEVDVVALSWRRQS